MGTSSRSAWCALDEEVVILAGPDAIRFPNAVLAPGRWDRLEPGETVTLGFGAVTGEGFACHIVRWWDPRVTPTAAGAKAVRAAVQQLDRRLMSPGAVGLEPALASGDAAAVLDRAIGLLGCGRGLTPEGDDLMIGAVAAFRHLTSSLGHPGAADSLDEVADAAVAVAFDVTTRLSATLLRHGFAGEVAAPVGDLLRALTGHGDLVRSVNRCLAIGQSTGSALAHGVLCGARAACEVTS